MSPVVIVGKSSPYGLPVRGLRVLGPVVPRQPPRTFGQMTNCLRVSMGFPGPTATSHQPGSSFGSCRATCESPLRAWQISTALSPRRFSRP